MTDGAAPFQYLTKSELAERLVRRRILSGDLAPGAVLNQVDLAAEIGVSTTPLREALNHLRAEGLVYTDANRETRIAPLNSDEAIHIYELRMNLDPLSARLAAERYTEADAKLLRSTAAELDAALDGPLDEIIETHFRFHRALHKATHNEILVGLLDVVWARSDRYRRSGEELTPQRPLEERRADHAQLLDAVLRRDADGAERAMRLHVENSMVSIAADVLARQQAQNHPGTVDEPSPAAKGR